MKPTVDEESEMAKRHLIGFVAHCNDCEWSTDDYEKGQRLAYRHASIKGHRVSGDATYMVVYDGRKQINK